MVSSIKKFCAVAGLLLAAVFSQNAAAFTFIDSYYSTGAAAQAACGGSCTGWQSNGQWLVYKGCGWETQCRYYYSESTYNACAGKPYTSPSGECRATPYTGTECGAYYPDGAGSCTTTAPDCGDLGQTWDAVAGACDWPDTPPTCGAGQIATVDSTGATVACTAVTDIDESCDYSKGYDASGFFICGDEEAGCSAKGGTAGYIDGQSVCIPPGYSPPICDSGQAVMLDAGGFVCSAPAVTPPPVPGAVTNPSSNPTPPPESASNTSGQSAAPGTGTTGGGSGGTGTPEAPAKEATEGTREASKTGEGRASGSCAAPPLCSGGDPQMCALLRQQWETMCKGNDLIEDGDENQAGVFQERVDAVIEAFGTQTVVETALGQGLGASGEGPVYSTEVGTIKGFFQSLVPAPASCTALTVQFPDHPMTLPCDKLNVLKEWIAWIFYMATVFQIFVIVFGNRKEA